MQFCETRFGAGGRRVIAIIVVVFLVIIAAVVARLMPRHETGLTHLA